VGFLSKVNPLLRSSSLSRPNSEFPGHHETKSNQPGDAPAINPRYQSEESDRRAIISGLRLARRLFAAPAP